MALDARKQWLAVVDKWWLDRREPGGPDHWAPALETCPPERIRDLQNDKLPFLARYLYQNSPFFREKFRAAHLRPSDIRSLADLPKLPVTTKEELVQDMAAHPPWGRFASITQEQWTHGGWILFTTSGSTAAPRPFRMTQHDKEILAWYRARGMWSMGARPGDSAITTLGFGPHVSPWLMQYGLHLMGVGVIAAGDLPSQQRAGYIQQLRPTILFASTSYVLHLGHVLEEMGSPPRDSSIRLIVGGFEATTSLPSTRRRVQEMWDAEFHQIWGATECTSGGFSCRAEAEQLHRPMSLHLMEDLQVFEVVDPITWEPLPFGTQGLLVTTSLFAEGTPLLRFLIGDLVTLNRRSCPCGCTHVIAEGGFQARGDDMLKIRGINIFPSAVEEVLRDIQEVADGYQLVIFREKDLESLRVVAEAQPHLPPAHFPRLERLIAEEMKARLELRPQVELRPYGSLPKSDFKQKRVIDLR